MNKMEKKFLAVVQSLEEARKGSQKASDRLDKHEARAIEKNKALDDSSRVKKARNEKDEVGTWYIFLSWINKRLNEGCLNNGFKTAAKPLQEAEQILL